MTTDTLPALTGSTKQIAWAEQIRAGLDRHIDTYIETQLPTIRGAAYTHIAPAIHAAALAQTDARWWIDNRDQTSFPTLARAAWRTITREQRDNLLATARAAHGAHR